MDYHLASDLQGDRNLKTVKGYIFISEEGKITFDFKVMASVVPVATSFYIVGSNENYVTEMLLVKMRKGKLKATMREADSLFTNIIQKAAVSS